MKMSSWSANLVAQRGGGDFLRKESPCNLFLFSHAVPVYHTIDKTLTFINR